MAATVTEPDNENGSHAGELGGEKSKKKKKKKDKSKKAKKGKKDSKKSKSKRKKKKEGESSSSSCSGSGSSTSGSDSEESGSGTADTGSSSGSGSSSSSSGADGERKKKKKKKNKGLDWDLLEVLWPKEDRPAKLQVKKLVIKKSMSEMLKIKEQFEREQEKKGLGTAVYSRDRKPKAKKFAAMKDDGEKKLHPARFQCLPRVEPALYWDQVPTVVSEVYRHLPLQHLGVEGVPEQTIVKLHNRKVPVELDMMAREVKDVRQVQIAVCNYVAVLRQLHPIDQGGAVLQMVMTEAGWAASFGDSEKQRVLLLKRFFDDAVRENSGRAVRLEPPLDYEMVRINTE